MLERQQCYQARRIPNYIADKWTAIIIYYLADKTGHFGSMQRRIPGILKKMLTRVLWNLKRDDLVHREVFQVVPPKTEIHAYRSWPAYTRADFAPVPLGIGSHLRARGDRAQLTAVK